MAAGSGSRFGGSVPKAFVRLRGRTLLDWSLEAASSCPGLVGVVVVVPRASIRDFSNEVGRYADTPMRVVVGGAARSDSVAAGLAAVPGAADIVLVHDAARALAPPELFAEVAAAVRAGHPAVVPGLPVVDTVKLVDADGIATATPDRASLRAIQTPQGFRRDVLVQAYEHRTGPATDDAGLVEALGIPVLVVPGAASALKITTRDDLERAERMLGRQASEVRA